MLFLLLTSAGRRSEPFFAFRWFALLIKLIPDIRSILCLLVQVVSYDLQNSSSHPFQFDIMFLKMVVIVLDKNAFFTLDNISKVVAMFVAIFTVWNIIINSQQIKKLNDEKSKAEQLEQAKYISTWNAESKGDKQDVFLSNADNTPVYNVFVFLASSQNRSGDLDEYLKFAIGDFEHQYASFIDVLPPGKYQITLASPGLAAGGIHPVPFIFFTDYKNTQWVRYPSGKLSTYSDYEKKFRELGFTPPYGIGLLVEK